MAEEGAYWVPGHVRAYLRAMGFRLPLEEMEAHIAGWDRWMRAEGEFYDYRDTDGFGRVYEVHRRSIMPAMRVCREWGSLLLDEKTSVVCSAQACTDWLERFFSATGFWGRAQETVVRAFGWGPGRSRCGWTRPAARFACATTTPAWWCRSPGTPRGCASAPS